MIVSEPDQPPDPATDYPPRESIRTRDYIRIDPGVFQGALPVVVFWIANSLFSAQIAIAASFVVSVIVFIRNKSSGAIRLLAILGFLIVSASAVTGLLFDSDRAFAAQNIIGDFVFAAIFLGSIAVGRPLIGIIARELTPGIQPVMDVRHAVFVQLTLINAALNVFTGVVRIFMFASLSTNTYVIVSRVAFLPLTAGFIVLCYVMITRTAIRIWPADMPHAHMLRGNRR